MLMTWEAIIKGSVGVYVILSSTQNPITEVMNEKIPNHGLSYVALAEICPFGLQLCGHLHPLGNEDKENRE